MISKKSLNALLAGAVAMTIASSALAAQAHDGPIDAEKEKCYGVVKAGGNDCAAAGGSHSCAGSAAVDGAGDEWIALPKGVCTKIVNGSLTPVSTTTAPAAEGAGH